jgi:hypothetical protein
MPAEETVKTALRQFAQITGVRPELTPAKGKDMGVGVEITTGGQKQHFRIIVKNEIRQVNIPGILEEVGKDKYRWLLIAQYIPQPLKDEFKKQGINYLETAGNGFIHAGNLFYFMGGQAVTPVRQTATGKLWKRTGLQFLFVVLTDPELLQGPYRKMADRAGIALGNIGQFLEELEQAGYLENKEGKHRLKNKARLFQQWAELYPIILKPKLMLGRFRFLREEDRKRWKTMIPQHFRWGGEPAGALYTGFLEPEWFTIYTKGPVTELVKLFRIVPDPEGDIEVVEEFWKTENEEKDQFIPAVPPLLAYAELIASLDSRNQETAVRIKNKYLND